MGDDIDYIEEKLRTVNYYRLSAYWFGAWKINEDGTHKDEFKECTKFSTVWDRYTFDRHKITPKQSVFSSLRNR